MLPPQHKIDAPAHLILSSDPAWDQPRITSETLEDAQGDADPARMHPVFEYRSGLTRYDLSAQTTYRGEMRSALDYLTGEPVRFVLRRLGPLQLAAISDEVRIAMDRHRVRYLAGEVQSEAAPLAEIWVRCASLGLADIVGGDVPYIAAGQRPSEQTMSALMDAHGLEGLIEIGVAVWHISQPLSDREKKASG